MTAPLTREKIKVLREAARVANADTDYIPPVMMRCDPDTILSLCDMAEASLRSQTPDPSSSEPVATLGQAYADLAAAQTDTDADIAEASSRNRSALYATFGPTPSQPVTGEGVEVAGQTDRVGDVVADLVEALREAEELLALVEHPSNPDPLYHERVKALGEAIGFGALMSTASAGWRERIEERGDPGGSEFVSGPCFGSVQRTLRIVRAALAKAQEDGE